MDTVLQEKENIDLPSCESGAPHSSEVLSPSPKRPCKCLSPPPKPIRIASKPPARCFGSPVSVNRYRTAAEGVVPANTQFNTRWAEKNFMEWARARNVRHPEDPVPLDVLTSHDAAIVCKYMSTETRKEDGGRYPPATVRSLLSGLNRIYSQ